MLVGSEFANGAADCAAIPRSDDCFDPPQGVSAKVRRGHIEFVLRCGAADLDAAGHLAAPTTAIANAQPSHGPRQVTRVSDDHVPDAVYDDARAQFNEKELADLTLAIAAINAWNRLSIAARLTPGTSQPAPAEPGAVGAPGVTGLASGDAR